MRRLALLLMPLLAAALMLCLLAVTALAQAPTAPVRILRIKGIIDPLVAQYAERGLGRGETRLFVILLDTPGGSDAAMRRIVQAILGAKVPVIVYVAPEGARAGSAGVFVTLAANIAAMAPGTNIGAAHPVGLGGAEITGTIGSKIANDAAAYARAIAEERGRNPDWAEQAVLNSVSITAQEAVDRHVVDLMAADLDDLLRKVNGRQVSTPSGTVTLDVSSAPRQEVPMSVGEQFFHVLINPDIAYVLMLIGMLAIVIELFHPGAILPAVTGVICLILAFIGLENLPLNWGGVALIVAGVVFFALDIKVSGFALSIGGAIALILGSLILFSPFGAPSPTLPALRVSPYLIVVMPALTAGLFLFALAAGLRAQRLPVRVSAQNVIGARGVAVTALDPYGIVHAQSEEWSAVAQDPPIAAGEAVEVVALEGLRVVVRKVQV